MVTGGLGFIGRHLVNRLSQRDDIANVTVVDRGLGRESACNSAILTNRKVKIVNGDIVDNSVMNELSTKCSVIYHLAAETHVQNSITDPLPFLSTNVFGTFSVLEAARKNKCRVIFTSTSEVYGEDLSDAISDTNPLEPHSPYAATKLAGDRLTAAYIRTYGLDATIVRLFNTYGPGQYFEKVIPMFICSVLCDLPLPVQGDGTAARDWSYVGDMCDRLVDILSCRVKTVSNLASGNRRTVAQIAAQITALAGESHPRIERFPERPGHVRCQRADTDLMRERYGPMSTSFEEGLKKTFLWYRDRIDDWKQDFLCVRSGLLSDMQ